MGSPFVSITQLLLILYHYHYSGTDAAQDLQTFTTCAVHPDVIAFVENGYVRGWNLSGSNVDLDRGTALFATRSEVDRWNTACIDQIEATSVTEGVDVIGCNPRKGSSDNKKIPVKVQRAGPRLQGVEKLSLRTSTRHRMRLMLLSNVDVKNGWANGTRVRLLPSSSWTAPNRQYKKRIPSKNLSAAMAFQAKFIRNSNLNSRDGRFLDGDKNKHFKVL